MPERLTRQVDDEQGQGNRRLRFELIFASVWLAVGLFVLPALIFWVGITLLGPYGEGADIGRFYADFFGDLATGEGRAWLLALGPLIAISLIRACFLGMRGRDQSQPPATKVANEAASVPDHRRLEPRIGE